MLIAMKTFVRLLGPALVMLAIALSSRQASALGPVDIEVGAKAGVGTNPISGSSVNPLGFGIGARGGISIFSIYLGLNLVDYIGSGDNIGGQYHALEFGGEVGYGFKFSILTIRPQVGFGNMTFSDSQTHQSISFNFSENSFYLEPGLTALLTFGLIYIGADANALIITNGPSSSGGNATDTGFTIHGQVGLSF